MIGRSEESKLKTNKTLSKANYVLHSKEIRSSVIYNSTKLGTKKKISLIIFKYFFFFQVLREFINTTKAFSNQNEKTNMIDNIRLVSSQSINICTMNQLMIDRLSIMQCFLDNKFHKYQ